MWHNKTKKSKIKSVYSKSAETHRQYKQYFLQSNIVVRQPKEYLLAESQCTISIFLQRLSMLNNTLRLSQIFTYVCKISRHSPICRMLVSQNEIVVFV